MSTNEEAVEAVGAATVPSPAAAPLHEDPVVNRRRWLVLAVMCLSLTLVVLALSSLNVAVPALQQALGASATEVHWIVDAYAIVFAGLLLPAGALSDRFGRKGALLGGLGVFGAGLLLAGTAESAGQVIVGRAVMGAGAAFIMPATLSLATAVFPPEERAKAIGIWAGFAGAGGALGPIVSGALLEHFWWGATMLVIVPVVALVVLAIAALAPRSRDSRVTPLDLVGSGLSLVAIVGLLFGIIEGAERGWTAGMVLGGFGLSVVALAAFVARERQARYPMLPMHFFTDRRFSVGSAVITLSFFVMFGLFLLLSLYLQYVRGYSALKTGLAVLPMPVVYIAAATRTPAIGQRFGPRQVMAAGFAMIAAGFGVLALATSSTPYLVLALAFVLLGIGLGLASALATSSIMSAVPLDKAGVGSAVNDTTRELGGALGIAMLGSLVSSLYRSQAELSSSAVPSEATATAEESLGGAWQVAQQLPTGGESLLADAQSAFIDAFQVTNSVSVAIALGASAMVLYTLRGGPEVRLAAEPDDPCAGIGRPPC